MKKIALASCWLVAQSFAATLTIEAEKARIRTVGAPTRGGWNLFSNGQVGDFVSLPAGGKYRVVVRAAGSPARGAWPVMVLLLDGQAVGKATVARKDFADYRFSVQAEAGPHRLSVAFVNDAYTGREDRNLYLDAIIVEPPAGSPSPTLASQEEAAMEAQRREDQALAKAREAIERHRKGEATVVVLDPDGKPVEGASVALEQLSHDFLFGCNIYRFDRYGDQARNKAYKRRFSELFNYATVAFYWRWYEPERGKPLYDYTDKVVAWCQGHGIRMKGHPLLWAHRAGIPRWAGNKQPPPEVQKKRVQEIIRRYGGKIEFWEVVNEPSHLRSLKIDEPYRWAREADPNAYLIVNDYHVMADGYPPFFALLRGAIANGVPFEGIGIQAHEPRTMRFPLDQVQRILDHYATLGKDLHITEFTPTSAGQPITGSHIVGRWDEAAQADYATKFYTVCFGHPAVVAITWWDLCDDGSWLRGGGMLRADMSPKPVYLALRKLIHETWHTSAEGSSDARGRFAFRGFFGRYRITAEARGKRGTAEVHLARGRPAQFTVRLPAR